MEELLAKFFAGETSEEEEEQVYAWRLESEENSRSFLKYKSVWAASTKTEIELPAVESSNDQPANMNSTTNRSNILKIAAAAAILLIATISFILKWEDWTSYDTGMVSIQRLDDGTKVYSYKESSVEIIDFSAAERRVSASGRVFFDVKEDAKRPFVIETPQAIVQVMGTSFQLTTEKEYTTEVIVESGRVNFMPNPKAQLAISTSILLNKGEKGIITPNAKGIIKQNNRDENYLAWQNLELTIQQKKLSEFSELLQEVYGYSLRFSNANLANCMLSAKYQNKSPEQIAELLATTFNLTFELGDNEILLSGDSCY